MFASVHFDGIRQELYEVSDDFDNIGAICLAFIESGPGDFFTFTPFIFFVIAAASKLITSLLSSNVFYSIIPHTFSVVLVEILIN